MDRERISRSLLLDIALAAGLCAGRLRGARGTARRGRGPRPCLAEPARGRRHHGAAGLGRRRAPFWVAVAVAAATAGRALAAEPLEIYPTSIALLVATYTVASYAPLRESLLAVGFGAMAVAVAVVQGIGTDAAPDPLASAILYGMVWLVGRVVVRHQRAVQLHLERDAHAAEAVADERARIAREMHDAASHSSAAIVMQSGGAANVLDSDPERARQSLASIEATARRGLEEMRRMLGLRWARATPSSRRSRGSTGSTSSSRRSVPRASRWTAPSVANGVRCPPRSTWSAYRLVQESLTNVMKHAGARSVRVALEQAPSTSTSRSSTTAPPTRPGALLDAGWPGCASARRCSAAGSRRRRCTQVRGSVAARPPL